MAKILATSALLLASALLLLVSAGSSTRIVIEPNVPIFIIGATKPDGGSTHVLSCQTQGDKPGMFSQLQWVGPNKLDNWDELKKRHRVQEEGQDSNIWELEFVNPTNDDSGIYHCLGTYHTTEKMNASIEVRVQDHIKVDYCPNRQFVVQDDTKAKITCRTSAHAPRFAISKDNQPIASHENRYKWDNSDSLDIIGPVNQSDAGIYTFKFKSNGERRTIDVKVDVHTKPTVVPFNGTLGGDTVHAVEDQQVVLECKASGNPQPIVHWYDPRRRNLTQVGGYIVNQEKGILTILKPRKYDDNGTFECQAWNSHAKTSAFLNVRVDVKPQIVGFYNQTVNENDLVTLECRSRGDPEPNFSIRKSGLNQHPYKLGDGFVKELDTTSEGGNSPAYVYRVRLVATKTMAGFHYCNATNRAGSAEQLATLVVNHKPDLRRTPLEPFVHSGKKYALTCLIEAVPEPKISWWIETLQIVNIEASVQKSPDGGLYTATMSPPENFRSGFNKFVCRAENSQGQSEAIITPKFKTSPGPVHIQLIEAYPTSAKIRIEVPNDGGDRIKSFKYIAEGRTLDLNHPTFSYRTDYQNETTMDAAINHQIYLIKKLLPYYVYTITVRAVNEVGEGEPTQVRVETKKPTRPDPPVIIKPTLGSHHSISGIPSEYQNGYVLRWSPPDADNGDPIQKYLIHFQRADQESGEIRVVEQMNERPLHARIGPLDVDTRYRVSLRARNKYGDSEPSTILVYTTADRPVMVEYEPQSLSWLTEPSTNTLIVLMSIGIALLILVDLIFCFYFEIGISHQLKAATLTKSGISPA